MRNKRPKEVTEFAAALKEYRLDHGWTLQHVADLTGLNPATVWMIENAKVSPHERTIRKIKKALPQLAEVEVA